ncbi:unnamed protein product [Blepharisma stoltei]|uniref:F-box domain-containing protein n=1 Tax=Blepharisma stoltei TaxID=1481888 RepID=A0AAU9J3X5_9CILI|nr:unnamed protein product [Blepharisma stoltei]
MDRIPRPVLSEILSQVGAIDQIITLSMVCKKWNKIISNWNHEISFQNIPYYKAEPWIIRSYITYVLTDKFLKDKWKLVSLDLKSVNVNVRILANLIIAQPNLRKLNLCNSRTDFKKLYHLLSLKKSECLKLNKIEIFFQLEELICTNLISFGQYLLDFLKMFPKLKKLKIGNCSITIDLFIFILQNFKNIEFIEASLTSQINSSKLEVLKGALQNSNLKFWLVNAPSESIFLFKDIKTCVYNYDVWLKKELDLEEIQKWLKLGGDINSCYKFINNLIEKYDDDFLIQAFQVFNKNGLDKWFHQYSQFSPINYCNYIANAALKRKIKLFWYLFDMGFHFFDCECFNILISCPEIINELKINQKSKIKFSGEKIYKAAQFFMIKHNEKYLMPLIDLMTPIKLGYIEEKIIKKNRFPPSKKKFEIPNYYKEISGLFHIPDIEPLISVAAILGLKNIIAALIHAGFNIDARDSMGNTALCHVAKYGSIDILKYLIENGADINNAINIKKSKSPIKMAIEKGRADSVIELINSGADLLSKDNNGLTALEYASNLNMLDIVEILKEAAENRENN